MTIPANPLPELDLGNEQTEGEPEGTGGDDYADDRDPGDTVLADPDGDYFYHPPETSWETDYETYQGLLPAPVAGPPGTPCRVVRVHAPYTTKVVHGQVARVGAKPRVPYWATNDNEVLLYRRVSPDLPELMKDEVSFIFRVRFEYRWLLLYNPADTDSYASGTSPLVNVPPESLAMQGSQFDRGLLRSQPPASYQGGGGGGFVQL